MPPMEEDSILKKWFVKYYKYIVVGVCWFFQFSSGCRTESMGPALPDFAFRTKSSYSALGASLSMSYVGLLLGNILSSPIFVRWPSHILLVMGFWSLWQSIFTALMPHMGSAWTLGLLMCLLGIGQGSQLNASHTLIIKAFGIKSGGVLQFIHIGFGVGNAIGPLIVRPFFSPNMRTPRKKICGLNFSSSANNKSLGLNDSIINSKIEYGFGYISIFGFITTVLMLVLYVFQQKYIVSKKKSDDLEVPDMTDRNFLSKIHPRIITNGKPVYGTFMLIGIVLFYLFQITGASLFTKFLTTMAMDRCKPYFTTQQRATLLQSLAAAAFTGSRLVSCFVINYRINLFLLVAMCLTVCMSGVYAFLARFYEIALWVGACGLRFAYGPMFPGGTSWLNHYINVDSPIITLAFLGATAGSFFGTLLGGIISDKFGPLSTAYMLFAFFVCMGITFVGMLLMGEYHGKREIVEETQDHNEKPLNDEEIATLNPDYELESK